jgi:hypothetical protein
VWVCRTLSRLLDHWGQLNQTLEALKPSGF